MKSTSSVRSFQVPPTPGNWAWPEFAFRADFAGHARDFTGEGVEPIDDGVDGVFELETLPSRPP